MKRKLIATVITLCIIALPISVSAGSCSCAGGCECGISSASQACLRNCNDNQGSTKVTPCSCAGGCACGNANANEACKNKCGLNERSAADKAHDDCVKNCESMKANIPEASYNACIAQCDVNHPTSGATSTTGSGAYNASQGGGGTSAYQRNITASTVNANVKANEELGETTCESLFGGNVGKIIKDAYNIIRFAVPILLLALSIKDYATAIIQEDDDRFKKATKTFIKRLIIAIVVLVAPIILSLILEIVGLEDCMPL